MDVVDKIIISARTVEQGFGNHLIIPNNKRILFSACFGAGKSYFLENFFNCQTDYLTISLTPIDYSIATNEDIFELIKYDILSALIEKYLESMNLQKEDFSKLLQVQEFIRNKIDFISLVKNVLAELLPYGKALKEAAEWVQATQKTFNTFQSENKIDERRIVDDFLGGFRSRVGSIRENDHITLLIKDFVGRIKRANEDKSFILILDDLDRLDPEHIFRLFNVFTAHQDSKSNSNKFDFDKVIFVCDEKNIYHMFKHRYGAQVDFAGYIDKFYSSHIFHFDFKKNLKQSIKQHLLRHYNVDFEFPNLSPKALHIRYDFKNHSNNFDTILIKIISDLIDIDSIKIRSLERFYMYKIPNYTFHVLDGRHFNAYDYPFLVLIDTLQQFFPTLRDLEESISLVSKVFHADYSNDDKNVYYDDSGIYNKIIEFSIPFIMEPKDAFIRDIKSGTSTFQYPNEENYSTKIYYVADERGDFKFKFIGFGEDSPTDEKPNADRIARPNPYWYMLCALKECLKNGFLRNSL